MAPGWVWQQRTSWRECGGGPGAARATEGGSLAVLSEDGLWFSQSSCLEKCEVLCMIDGD